MRTGCATNLGDGNLGSLWPKGIDVRVALLFHTTLCTQGLQSQPKILIVLVPLIFFNESELGLEVTGSSMDISAWLTLEICEHMGLY